MASDCWDTSVCVDIGQENGKGKQIRVQHVTGNFTRSHFSGLMTSKADHSALRKTEEIKTNENTLPKDLAIKE